ncbi:hypothetical protein PMAYCL1PPCAC_04540, partial [Pristionchus mayeri]
FFISLNRLISLEMQYLLKQYDRHFFLLASYSSLILAIIVSFPTFFSHYYYAQISVGDGKFGYIPYIPEDFKRTAKPANEPSSCNADNKLRNLLSDNED